MSGKYVWDFEISKDKDKHEEKLREIEKEKEIAEAKRKELEKQRREKELKEQRRRENIRRERNKKVRKRIIIVLSIITVTLLVLIFLFYPLYLEENIALNGSEYYQKDELIQNKERYSFVDILMIDYNLQTEENLLDKVDMRINFFKGTINFNVTEDTIIGYNTDGELEYIDNDKVKVTNELLLAPYITNLENKEKILLAKQVRDLPSDIYLQIASISKEEYSGYDRLVLQMKDGNVVYVLMSEFSEKMKYYNYIKEIIDEVAGTTGYIHLDIGDYYEPKE